MNKRVLILTTRDLSNAPRVIREIEILHKIDYEILAIGTVPPIKKEVQFISVSSIKKSLFEKAFNLVGKFLRILPLSNRLISQQYKKIFRIIDSFKPSIVISHEPDFLLHLIKLRQNFQFKIIYNAHEYHPLEFSEKPFWNFIQRPFFEKIYKNALPKVDMLINVCESISEKCFIEYGKRGIVIPNAAFFYPNDSDIQRPQGVIKIIHHGACLPGRQIEDMIKIVQLLGDAYHLDLMLTAPDKEYFNIISAFVEQVKNVSLIPPVKFDQIVDRIKEYDVGMYLLPPNNFNNKVALPNKFFEFIQARLCIIIGPSQEMAKIVEKFKLGLVSNDFKVESMVKLFSSLDRDRICEFKRNTNKAAYVLSAEYYDNIFLEELKQL